ncbi:MAG: lantibiotic dehydratase [Clostridia bacterium]|nr:lantibiotic dehydratase [Clostridia bacterium]
MDGVKLFPYCLERSTNVPKAALKAIECPELPEAADAYRTSVMQLQAVGAEGIRILEHAYSLCQNPDILKAKRKMMAGKIVTNGEKFTGSEYEDLISRYNRQVEETLQAGERYRILFAECLDRNRDALRAFFKKDRYVLRTLPLINKDFIFKLNKYLDVPVKQHNADIRKLDHQLIRLFTRATMKTSPFSFLTSVCLYDPETGNTEKGEGLRSICEANNYIIKAIYDFILEKPHFACQVSYRLNAHQNYGDSCIFLYQRDYEKGKVYKTVDGTVRLARKGIIEQICERFGNRVFRYEELLSLLTENGMEEDQAHGVINQKLIPNHVMTPHLCIDDTKEDIFLEFEEKTAPLADDEAGTLAKVRDRVREYEKLVKEFENADWRGRFAAVDKIDRLVAEIEDVLDRKFVHNIQLYEDSVYDRPKNPLTAAELKGSELDKLQKYFRIFDQGVLSYVLFSEMFLEKYGEQKVPADDLDVYKLFVQASTKLTGIWVDNFSTISFKTGEKIQTISAMKKEMYAEILGRKNHKEAQDLRAFIDAEVDKHPEIFSEDIDSATFYLQKAEKDGQLMINKVYKGQLLFFVRFLKLFDEDSKKISDYCRYAFGPNPAEVTESFGFNANVHRRIFDRRLVLNMTDQNDATEGDIPISECFFYYDPEKKLVKLGHEALGEVNGVFLGSLAINLMPIPLRTVNGMQPSTRFDPSYLNLWEKDKNEGLIADHIPRMQYGKLVFIREQYLLNSIYDLGKPADELYLEILADFEKAGLPKRFFIRPYLNGDDFDFYNMGRTALKPQYIDLNSPLLFQELLREMENQKQFVLEEIYPDNREDEYICEYQVEQTLYR